MEQIKQENLQSSSASQGEVHTKEKKRQEIKMTGKGKALTEKAAEEQKSVSVLREEPQRRRTVTFGKNPPTDSWSQRTVLGSSSARMLEGPRGASLALGSSGEQERGESFRTPGPQGQILTTHTEPLKTFLESTDPKSSPDF